MPTLKLSNDSLQYLVHLMVGICSLEDVLHFFGPSEVNNEHCNP